MRVPPLLIGTLGALSVATTSPATEEMVRFEAFVAENRPTAYPSYWLAYLNRMDQLENVTLVFGFVDNQGFCEDIARLYMERYPSEAGRYFCTAAN